MTENRIAPDAETVAAAAVSLDGNMASNRTGDEGSGQNNNNNTREGDRKDPDEELDMDTDEHVMAKLDNSYTQDGADTGTLDNSYTQGRADPGTLDNAYTQDGADTGTLDNAYTQDGADTGTLDNAYTQDRADPGKLANVDESLLDPQLNQQPSQALAAEVVRKDGAESAKQAKTVAFRAAPTTVDGSYIRERKQEPDQDDENDQERIAQIEEADAEMDDSVGLDMGMNMGMGMGMGFGKMRNENYMANMSAVANVSQMQTLLSNAAAASVHTPVGKHGGSVNKGASAGDGVADSDKLLKPASTAVSKPTTGSKRAAQNRAAQRAFRQRRKSRIENLEKIELKYEKAIKELELLRAENENLKKQLGM